MITKCTAVKRTPVKKESTVKTPLGVSLPPVDVYTENTTNMIKGSDKEKYPRLKALIRDPFSNIQNSDLKMTKLIQFGMSTTVTIMTAY